MTIQIHSSAQYTEPLKLDVLWKNLTDTENWALDNFLDNSDHPVWDRVTELSRAYDDAKNQYRIPQDNADDDTAELIKSVSAVYTVQNELVGVYSE